MAGPVGSAEAMPERPYTRDELRNHLGSLRQRRRMTLLGMDDEAANRVVAYPWSDRQSISYLELQLYNLRHVQEHATQLALVPGQHGVPGAHVGWVPWAAEDSGN